MTTKRCPPGSACGNWFPATTEYFYKDEGRTKTDNLSLYCKKCKNRRTRANYAKHKKAPLLPRMRWLHRVIQPLPQPRYDSLIRKMLELACARHKTEAQAAMWLGMKPGTFGLMLVKFKVPINKEVAK
jgi:hypothetical protein